MLPSKKRLSRSDFTLFLKEKGLRVVFNNLGTLKYSEGLVPKVAIVISSKNEKRAVKRNLLRRRLYSLFNKYIEKNTPSSYVLYTSKQATSFTFSELSSYIDDLFKKIAK